MTDDPKKPKVTASHVATTHTSSWSSVSAWWDWFAKQQEAMLDLNQSILESSLTTMQAGVDIQCKVARAQAGFIGEMMKNTEMAAKFMTNAPGEPLPDDMNTAWMNGFRRWVGRQYMSFDFTQLHDNPIVGDEIAKEGYTAEQLAEAQKKKDIFAMQARFMPEPISSLAMYNVMFDPKARDVMIRKSYPEWLHYCGQMTLGEDELHKPQWNHKFLTEKNDHSLGTLTDDEIARLFPTDTDQTDFPRIILTSNHADGTTADKALEVIRGVEAITRDSMNGKLNLAHLNGRVDAKPGNVLVIMANDAERNVSFNGEKLYRRLDELKSVAESGSVDNDQFIHASPGAKRLARLMLKCMVADPSKVDTGDEQGNVKPLSGTIALRKRPELIAQHFQLMGYSRGGNVVTDAMRYLDHELRATKGGRRIIQYDGHPITDDDVGRIQNNVAMLTINAIETGLMQEHIDRKIARVALVNKKDPISYRPEYHYDENPPFDVRMIIEGKGLAKAHVPPEALGTIDDEEARTGKRGYALDGKTEDGESARRRVKEWCAPLFGKASVSNILFIDEAPRGEEKGVVLVVGRGTSDELFQKFIPKIETAMKQSGLTNVKVETVGHNNRRFVLHADQDMLNDPAAIKQLHDAFCTLRGSTTANLVIADSILIKATTERSLAMGGPELEPPVSTRSPD